MISKTKESRGQMTVELCVVFPVAIAIAVIVVNAMTFFGYCTEFDRVARNAVRVAAISPDSDQDRKAIANLIQKQIEACISADNISIEVIVVESKGLDKYKATIKYWPTLFGLGMKSSIFGVRMPALSHVSTLSVDACRSLDVFV